MPTTPPLNSAHLDGWNVSAAGVLRQVCKLDGGELAKALSWWGKLRVRGPSDGDIQAAIKGLPHVVRVTPPWRPYCMFKKANRALFLEAMSAGRKRETGSAKRLGAIMAELTKPACLRCGNELVAGHCIATPGWCRDHPLKGCERERSSAMLNADWNLWRADGRPETWERRYPLNGRQERADHQLRAAGDAT
jgi:hypothetical protein